VLILVFGAFLNAASMTFPVENALNFSRFSLGLISRPALLPHSLLCGSRIIAPAHQLLVALWLAADSVASPPVSERLLAALP